MFQHPVRWKIAKDTQQEMDEVFCSTAARKEEKAGTKIVEHDAAGCGDEEKKG